MLQLIVYPDWSLISKMIILSILINISAYNLCVVYSLHEYYHCVHYK